MRYFSILALISLVGLLSNCGPPPKPNAYGETYLNVGRASSRIEKYMTETELIKAVGSSPWKTEMITCGQKTSQSWSCKKLTWGDEDKLVVLLEQLAGDSMVISWFIL
jgi:hypothetical protein